MHKITSLLILFITLTAPSLAQSSAANTKKLLTSHEWELKYYLEGGQKSEIPGELKGLRLVFMPSKDLIYEYTPGDQEMIYIRKGVIEEQHFKFEDRIEEPEMIIDIDMLEKQGKLSFKSEFARGGKYSVYERVDKVKDKGYPTGKYEVLKPEVPMQRIHPELQKMITNLNTELKKSIGNLYFFDKNKTRFLVKDLNFAASDYGIKYSFTYDMANEKNNSYSYEFMPENIASITDVKMDPESRVGRIKLDFSNEEVFFTSPLNKSSSNSALKTIYLHYFRESANSFSAIKNNLEELSEGFMLGRTTRTEFLPPFIDKGRKIWLSLDGKSSNYQLSALNIAGDKLYIHYNLDMVGLSDSKKGSYLTVVPLKDITALTVEQTKSNPKTLLMHSKKGFETFAFKTDMYLPSDKVYVLPLFNYGELNSDQHRIFQILKQLITDDGGESIKVTYNP